MTLDFETLTGGAVANALDDLARLRAEVFSAWPYLYDGDPENEAAYLESYAGTPDAIVVVARMRGRTVGCATGMPLEHHADARDVPLDKLGLDMGGVYYLAESVLLAECRGAGAGHVFFDRREAHARAAGYGTALFCAVERPVDHPKRPSDARDLAPFWEGRGYVAREAHVTMRWTDIGQDAPSEKSLRVWTRAL